MSWLTKQIAKIGTTEDLVFWGGFTASVGAVIAGIAAKIKKDERDKER
jgi:hypothetical protein